MQRTIGWKRAFVTAAVIALSGAMSACRNGPNNAADTNGMSAGGASGQVLPSAADTVHHDSMSADTAHRDTTRRDTTQRRP